jgi:colicin import membrane protein
MKNRTNARAYPMVAGDESRALPVYFGVSLLIHLILIGSAVYLPDSNPRPRLGQGAINVSLVSLPGPPAAAPAPAPASVPVPKKPDPKTVVVPKKEVPKPPPKPVIEVPQAKPLAAEPKPAKTVSLAPKKMQPKVKKSLKKKTQNPQKMIDQAVSRVQKNVEKSQSDSVRQAIDRLKKKVAQSEAGAARPGQAVKGTSAAAGGGVSGATGPGGKRALEITDLYKIEVAFQVERHWALSQQLAGDDSRLQTKLVFRVLPSGEITDIRFTQRSGNSHLDESAYRAVVKANPVSPHPAEIRVPYVTVALRFTPEGLKK